MKVTVRGNDRNFPRLVSKIRGRGFTVIKENRNRSTITFDVPKSDSEFVYELLEFDAIIERDVRNDLD